MSLALAIKKNAAPLAAAQNTYKENVVGVNTLVTSVLTSSLPTLNTNPPDWQDFVHAYEAADADALNWVNNVMARLLDVPDDVRNYNPIVSQLLQDAKAQATTLIGNPDDKAALAALLNDLANLSSQLNLVVTFISGAVSAVQDFKDKLPDMASELQTIADKSTKDAKADQKQIDELKADIASLQADIKSLTAAIVGLAIADGIALTIGVVATIALWPVGAVTWFMMGPAVAAATTFIALDAVKISDDKKKIDQDKDRIKGITADVATLHVLAKNYSDMANQTKEIETNLQAVLREWQTLQSDVDAAISDIRTASSDTSADNFQAALNDINEAVTEWDAAYQQAGNLHLDLQVNNAQLELGMSQDQVRSALNGGRTVGIIEYYNQLKTAAAA